MEASRAATGMLEVLATRVVRFMIPTSLPLCVIVSSGNSASTSAISLPRSPGKNIEERRGEKRKMSKS